MADAALELDLAIEAPEWSAALPGVEAFTQRVLEEAARAQGVGGVVGVLLTEDAAMQALNLRWRAKDSPTNVLSFPAAAAPLEASPRPLGDLALGLGVLRAEARAQGKPFAAHFAHLLVHGFLHLLGHDHEHEAEAAVMEAREISILAGLGLPDPYQSAESSSP